MARILVVDSDEAFAAMLQDMLETEGHHAVQVAHSGRQALELLRQGAFALTIVDMGLDEDGSAYLDLIRRVRQAWPAMRLVLIPLRGGDLPPEAGRLDIQGVLSKPFFADDLVPAIEEALTRPVRPAGAPPPSPAPAPAARPAAPPPAPVQDKPAGAMQPVLAGLARETGADVALYISAAPGHECLLGHASALGRQAAEGLVGPIVAAIHAAQAVRRALGQGDDPFEHNMYESGTARLYVMALPGDRLLAVVTPAATPLGNVRGNLRRAARELAG